MICDAAIGYRLSAIGVTRSFVHLFTRHLTMNFAIESQHLYKSFDGVPALQNLNLQVEPGIVYGLLGPNGAGKSTFLYMLLGFLRREQGTLRVLGSSDLQAARAHIGYLPQAPAYNLHGTAREYLHFLGRLRGLRGSQLSARVVEELEAFDISAIADRTISTFTRPALQRLGFAQAMIKAPRLLLIDEPTAGTEAEDRTALLDILGNLRTRVQTILLATHNLDEAELLCDRVGILAHGRLMADVNVTEMRAAGRNALITVTELSPALALKLCALDPAVQCSSYEVALQPNSPVLQALVLRTLLNTGVQIIALEPFGRPLEELYARAVQGLVLPPLHQSSQILATPPTPQAYVTQPLPAETSPSQPTETPVSSQPIPPAANETLLNELLSTEKRQQP